MLVSAITQMDAGHTVDEISQLVLGSTVSLVNKHGKKNKYGLRLKTLELKHLSHLRWTVSETQLD